MARKPSAKKAQRANTITSITMFLNDALVGQPGGRLPARELYRAYLDWYDALAEAREIPMLDREIHGIEFDLLLWERASETLFGIEAGQIIAKRVTARGTMYLGVALSGLDATTT